MKKLRLFEKKFTFGQKFFRDKLLKNLMDRQVVDSNTCIFHFLLNLPRTYQNTFLSNIRINCEFLFYLLWLVFVDRNLPREMSEARIAVGWEPQKKKSKGLKFPQNLILGQEQLEVMKSCQNTNNGNGARVTFLIGESGCGKTTTLLALLFKYTGKHVSEKRLRNVVFFVPKCKTEFKKYVKQFIEDHCNGKWVQLIPLHCMQSEYLSPEKIYLVDEFYGSSQVLYRIVKKAKCRFFVATVSVKSGFLSLTNYDERYGLSIYFRRAYRSPEAISRVSSKLRRLIDRSDVENSRMTIPWAMSFFNGAPTNLTNPFEVIAFTDTVISVLGNLSVDSRRSLLVTFEYDQQIVDEIDQKFRFATKYHLTYHTKFVEDIPFTGSEFDEVAIFLAENVECCSDLVLLLLHSAISRATSKVFIVCHETDKNLVTSMLSLEGNNDVIFERLRYSSNVYSGNLDEMKDPKDRLELLKRLIVTRNESKFKSLKLVYDENKLSNGERELVDFIGMVEKTANPNSLHKLVDALTAFHWLSTEKISRVSDLNIWQQSIPLRLLEIPQNFEDKRWFKISIFQVTIHRILEIATFLYA